MKHATSIIAVLLCASLASIGAYALPTFPELTGRVVDNAGMLDSAREREISQLLEAHETATTNQVAVVTLPDLGGYSIETYGYQLGREWGIGQEGKDNGVLLIVAKSERKVRIEVGYGLEGTLTDAISSNIVYTVILPLFKQGDFDAGIERGARAIIQALEGQYTVKPDRDGGATSDGDPFQLPFMIIFLVLVGGVVIMLSIYVSERWLPKRSGTGGYVSYGGSIWGDVSSQGWGGSSQGRDGFSSGGGFSGGGGSFGGGGASGGW